VLGKVMLALLKFRYILHVTIFLDCLVSTMFVDRDRPREFLVPLLIIGELGCEYKGAQLDVL